MEGDNPDDNEVWTPPESTNEGYPPSQPYSSSSQSFSASSSQPVNVYSQASYVHDQYQPDDARVHQVHFSQGSYTISTSAQHLYQPASSSYERMSPIDYREMPSGSDAISSYSAIQPSDGAQLMSGHPVDSSTLQQPEYPVHQVVLDSDHRILTVQRVISPVDCTVSQSALSSLSHQDSESDAQQTTHALLTPVPVTSVQRYPSMPSYSSSSEVSTTGGSPMISHTQNEALSSREVDSGVSSLSSSMPESRYETLRREREDSISGEPDTTQEDSQLEEYRNASHVHGYIVEESSSIEDTEPVLHSTMVSTPGPSMHRARGGEIMDTTLDSTQLGGSRGHPIGLSSAAESIDSSLDRNIDSSALTNEISGHMAAPVAVSMGGMVTLEDMPHIGNSLDGHVEDKDGMNMGFVPVLRKSNRIAEIENEPPSWQKPKYKPKPYNPNEIWCDECMTSYIPACPTHKLTLIPDKVVLSRAWASLPPMLQIFRLGEPEAYTNEPHVGVFSKRLLLKNTQFGPFVGELLPREKMSNHKFPLALEKPNGEVMYFEMTDENKCNWMMFVRPAENFADQNMVAYQYGLDIYFTVTRNVQPRSELKVWYAPHYAGRFGFQTLEITDQDIQVLDEQECKFQCYECPERFRTQMALQRHIVLHEAGPSGLQADITGSSQVSLDNGEHTPQAPSQITINPIIKKRGRPPKKIKYFEETYMWKKKSTSIYLSKTLKKYHKRRDDTVRRNFMSLYRKKGKESGGNEWVCTHCDLTFNNSNLLNLHTLTHAAEDVGLDEVKRFAYTCTDENSSGTGEMFDPLSVSYQDGNIVSLNSSTLACPVCHLQFTEQRALIEHASEHATQKKRYGRDRPHKCDRCWKAFYTQEKLQRHMLCHGDEESKPLQCNVCFKRFMNNSALSCHMKIHSDKKYYSCPICNEGFDHTNAMKAHVIHHSVNGIYTCPECQRMFDDFFTLRKHMRGFHTNKEYPCTECDKVFPRPDKLRLHMLRHSSHREFMCETCGRQFKRKDKLKEHTRRMHSLEREAKNAEKRSPTKKFIPKVAPTDFHRFIYKCHLCMLGFKRRGMLVNHLAKRHPDIKPESVPELNLPILKTQKDYYCNYCEKVYKSSSKRKAHILKNHPGSVLPLSARKRVLEVPGMPNPTYSQTVGSITTMPHSCEYCHKQYASKAKLTQHQRKKHPQIAPPMPAKKRDSTSEVQPQQEPQTSTDHQAATVQHIVRLDADNVLTVQQPTPDGIQAADLLTQAMSELTQSLQEYRQPGGEYHVQARIGPPTMVHLQAPHSSIELSQLGQALTTTQFIPQQGQLAGTPIHVTVTPSGVMQAQQEAVNPAQQPPQATATATAAVEAPAPEQQSAQQQVIATQAIVVSAPSGPIQAIPVSLTPGSYIARSWPNYQYR